MTEYALILTAVALVVFALYVTMGGSINAMITWNQIDRDLTSAS